MSFIPAADIPPWAFGLLASTLVGWVLWHYVIKRGITRSRIRRDIDQLLAERPLENGEGGKSLETQLLAAGMPRRSSACSRWGWPWSRQCSSWLSACLPCWPLPWVWPPTLLPVIG